MAKPNYQYEKRAKELAKKKKKEEKLRRKQEVSSRPAEGEIEPGQAEPGQAETTETPQA